MGLFQHRIYRLFVYFSAGKAGFWVFDGARYHHFYEAGPIFRYVRACPRLPDGAFGECVDVTEPFAVALNQCAQEHGVRLQWFEDALDCELAEMEQAHPAYIFGLSVPAAQVSFSDTIGRQGEAD